MASGYGYGGGRSRCYPFWQEFHKCYALADKPEECVLQRDDYLECLHHSKEAIRTKTIQDEQWKQKEKRAKEAAESKKKADSTSASNVPRLNVVEEKAKKPDSA
ncbi:hypothetical protein B0O80DRAFT_440745 [Mortierella sp. GBAus27b]|nr:hypothetical protein BGX31_006547 [Mortierella sp. GBA43]KAI8359650.1 hypothetical protein B0O80DRAFT_440745 [Mortierella sp. GBAus27b]